MTKIILLGNIISVGENVSHRLKSEYWLTRKENGKMSGEKSGSGFKPLKNGFGIQPIGPSPAGGDVHDTFRVNKEGNVSGGHTTVRIPGGQKVHLPWSK